MNNNDESFRALEDDEFIAKYGKLVPYAIKKMFSPGALSIVSRNTNLEYEDLTQIGFIGLCKARKKFDPSYGYAFSTYAHPLIQGEIQRALRDNSKIKVSRGIHDLRQKIIKADMLHDSISSIAAHFNVCKEDVKKALGYSPSYLYLFSTPSDNNQDTKEIYSEAVPDGFDLEEEVLNKELIESFYLKGGLTDTEKNVWHLYAYEKLSQVKVAERVGVSQTHVSRILQNVLLKARAFGKRTGLQHTQ
ncbi:hypothetical protein BXO87_02220 [Bacillus sp. GZB]|uniref:sigma-70 family RNA polymerase sigma factor n=1 Tax=Bacillus sp. GZB TaxID=936599 RepID=UPI00097616C1|nr:sigma-70 family RNA polymerase sigma factor [Bacillus sp. GZB]OMQ06841.1 hypothetical protein BXO87_02220 [Bacillus sp. GZB]